MPWVKIPFEFIDTKFKELNNWSKCTKGFLGKPVRVLLYVLKDSKISYDLVQNKTEIDIKGIPIVINHDTINKDKKISLETPKFEKLERLEYRPIDYSILRDVFREVIVTVCLAKCLKINDIKEGIALLTGNSLIKWIELNYSDISYNDRVDIHNKIVESNSVFQERLNEFIQLEYKCCLKQNPDLTYNDFLMNNENQNKIFDEFNKLNELKWNSNVDIIINRS